MSNNFMDNEGLIIAKILMSSRLDSIEKSPEVSEGVVL